MSDFKYTTVTGVKQGLVLKGGTQEKYITKQFGKFFGVTFSKQGRFKTTEYVMAFLKPEEKLRESFNMFNEVLLLFSPYTTFERRTLDFIDKTLSEFDNRLDKVCIFIVSKDNKIADVIKQINTENKDSKILVPFTYKEILDKNLDKDELDNRLRKYFYNRDLFALESPLKTDAYFFGRNNIVQSLYDKYSLGEQGGLFGLRKIGKTSVLFALERVISLRGGNSIYIDCQNPAVHKGKWNELLYHIISEIKDKYNIDNETIGKEEYYTERMAASMFEKDIIKIKEKLNDRRILIIFDEIEHIGFQTSTTEHWANGNDFINLWQTIRAIFQKDSTLISFILTGVNPLCIESPNVNGYDNPIFGMVNPTYLELFKIKDVKEMISNIGKYMGLSFDEEIFARLTDDYGGHPFLIRHICSLINSEAGVIRPYAVTKYEYSERKEEYDKQISKYISLILNILEKWYPEEYNLLELLAIHGSGKFKEEITSLDNEINHLIGYGILKEDRGNYYITISSISDYIKERYKSKMKPNSKEAVWQKVSLERNTIETALRKLIITTLISNLGKKNAKERILAAIDEKRRSNLIEKDIKYIFENYLFLLDLKNIITREWTLFQNIVVDKSKFTTFIDVINKYRIDAHAKSISDDDYAILIIAFKWFNDMLDEFMII